jgi:replication initiation protein RepC
MQSGLSTTPFGRRPLSLAMVAGQITAKECPPGATVNKWQVFRAVCEAKTSIGATDRALAVLNALLSFHPEADLSTEGDLVVFPSNVQLALRAHGMAPATLRRHLSVLVECGLLVRRDSPNGKRYARKGEGGSIEQAFGFDLTPLLARAAEFERLADAVRAERRALQLMRERITLCRRDIAKMIAFGLEEGITADWERLHAEYRAIVGQIPRTATRLELDPIEQELQQLAAEVRNLLETHVKSENMNANESHFERHIQNSKPDSYEFEPGFGKKQGASAEPKPEPKSAPPTGYPLGMVLRACPDVADYARNGISSWPELIEMANLVRGALGVSPDAWHQACEAMGAVDAAIVVAAILQRGEKISSPGGYLRSLTDKARAGQFSVGPVLMALLRARGRSHEARAG